MTIGLYRSVAELLKFLGYFHFLVDLPVYGIFVDVLQLMSAHISLGEGRRVCH